jgi:tetratricopeptide (TPR) repeat protein
VIVGVLAYLGNVEYLLNRAEKRRQRKLAKKSRRLAPAGGQPTGNTPDIQQALDLALRHQGAGELFEAEGIYQQILKIDPNQPVALHLLGVIAHQAGKNDIAVDLITNSLAAKPDYIEAQNTLGLAFQGLGKLDEAVSNFQNALALKPDYAEAHYNLGNGLQDMGKLDEAVASYHMALTIKPDYAEAHNNLGNLLQDMGKLDEAVSNFYKALALKPDLPGVWFNLHVTLFDTADLEPAAECLEKALEINPVFPRARFDLGIIRDYQGNAEAAAHHFERARKEADWIAFCLDSWQYVKSVAGSRPHLFGDTSVGFSLGFEAARIDGLVLEFGVRFGTSIRQISALANQDVHGFDSFQGLPESWHKEPRGIYTTHGQLPTVPGNVYLHVGLFEDTLPSFLKKNSGSVRFANIDCDIYSSTKTVLVNLADRIVPGTVLIFDEYLGNPQWREDEFKAFQEAVHEFGWRYEYLAFSLLSQQAIVLIS